MAAGEELSRLEELLRRPDFVLEPNVKDSVRQYIKAGGKPEVILESLSEGYVGYAHMAMLMAKWMEAVDDEPSAEHDEFFYLKAGAMPCLEFVKSKFDPDKFISVFGSQSTRAQVLPWLDGLLSDPRGRKLIYELSAAHRNSLLLNFAIQKIMKMGYQDEVAAAGSGLASYFSVFHKLLTNKVSALVAAVRRAAEAEAEAEAAREAGAGGFTGAPTAGSAAATAAAAAAAEAASRAQQEVAAVVRELQDSSGPSQHTYLHVQHVLRHLGSQPGGEALLAAAQALEAAVAGAATGVSKLFLPPGCPSPLVDAAHLVGRMLAAGPEGPGAADVGRLHALYFPGGGRAGGAAAGAGGGSGGGSAAGGRDEVAAEGDVAAEAQEQGPLSVAPLQHPRLLKSLLAAIFTPSRPPSRELLTSCSQLLALATCSRPSASSSPALSAPVPSGERAGSEAPGHSRDPEAEAAEAAATADRVAETEAALRWAAELVQRGTGPGGGSGGGGGGAGGGEGTGGGGGVGVMSEEDLEMASQLGRLPVVAAGLLHAVSQTLGSAAFFDDPPAAAAAVPGMLRVSLVIAAAQPHMATQVLTHWSRALTELHRSGLPEQCRLVLDACVLLLREAAEADAAEAEAAADAAAAAAAAARPPSGSGSTAMASPFGAAAELAGSAASGPAAGAVSAGAVTRQVLELVEAWGKGGAADAALLRYFVLQVLGCFAPPYPPDLASALLRLLLAGGMRGSHIRGEAPAALLREFRGAVEGLGLALSAKELNLLAELAGAGAGGVGGAGHVLRHLGSQPGGEALLAAVPALEAAARHRVAGAATGVAKLSLPPGCPSPLVDAAHLVGRMLAAGPEGPGAADVGRLYALYFPGGGRAGGAAAGAGVGSGGGSAAGGRDEVAAEGDVAAEAQEQGPLSVAPLQHPRLLKSLLAAAPPPPPPPPCLPSLWD
ncbi:hypothetical protein HYH03_011925 [Edaphochlamys debaryana]|uniref:Uncharacterized protein n=1 Tax=Edaphochlamys debaryana TaxID=47281 RepID=A0A835XT62_9CHLO|nr:hypothetical protein HYH03_011925 [Edaphochlamys debaryana]|eukprot:KAG2489646.1 hypothetical protein HYH03_011925 [Edaphochlamys debaryana]